MSDSGDQTYKNGPSKNPTRNLMTMKPAGLVQSGMQMVGILQRILTGQRDFRQGKGLVSRPKRLDLHHGGHDDSRLEPGQDQRSRKLGDDVPDCVRPRCKAECQQDEQRLVWNNVDVP